MLNTDDSSDLCNNCDSEDGLGCVQVGRELFEKKEAELNKLLDTIDGYIRSALFCISSDLCVCVCVCVCVFMPVCMYL